MIQVLLKLLFGHTIRGLSLTNITFTYSSTTFEVVDLEILNLYDKSFIVKFSLKRISVN